MKLGFLYAGQGAQHPGMGADLYEKYPAFRAALDGADAGFDLKAVSFADPDGLLNETQYTQPCMVAFAVGLTDVLAKKGIVPAAAAGLSLGEYSALYAAGVLDGKAAVEMVAFRGKAMTDAAKGVDSAMMAILGADRETVTAACKAASSLGIVEPCNFNCPGQIVIGGERAAVEQAAAAAKELGAKRCMPLNVSGPFHTSLLKPAGDALREYFKTVDFQAPQIPVLHNCLGGERQGGDSIPALLERQVQSAVYMEDCIRAMAALGVDAVVEIGPGKALTGFVKKTLPSFPVFSVETAEDVEKLPELLKEVVRG
ncbi:MULTISPECIES: ACP S-malonyltransferase [unclassified Oscillibacter]|uniref:ACP S-malonyltransferase n=1 Tax=unclassified Oscillibacter TaxID=2629304 RepID=UPI0025DD758A|nr:MULTISPECIES: ACP S-malonyltransferase [unclassified Oscillibacter]